MALTTGAMNFRAWKNDFEICLGIDNFSRHWLPETWPSRFTIELMFG